jgi:hypothetical protein
MTLQTSLTAVKCLLLACVLAGVMLLCQHHTAVGAHVLERQDQGLLTSSTSKALTGVQLLVGKQLM